MDPITARINKLKKIINESSNKPEDGVFVYEYLQTLCPDFRIFFNSFKPESFFQWIGIASLIELNENDILFKKNDDATHFFIVIDGNNNPGIIETFLQENDSKTIISHDKGKIFGKKDVTTKRDQFAKASRNSLILSVPSNSHFKLGSNLSISDAEKKIEFLFRFVPKLRFFPKKDLEELETFFIRERFFMKSKIIKLNEYNENIYFVFSGKCRIIIPLNEKIVEKATTILNKNGIKYLELETKG